MSSSRYAWPSLFPSQMQRGARCIHAGPLERLLEKNFCHHPLVLMAQQMTVKKRNTSDDGIGEIHHQVDISFDRDIHGIEPFRAFEPNTVSGIDEEVDLMNVERMHLVRIIRDVPVMKSPDRYGCHGWIRRTVFLPIDVEAVLVLGEVRNKIRRSSFYVCDQSWRQRLENRHAG